MRINVPVIADVDVLVVGGSCSAVRGAVELRKRGLKVFCATGYSYLGDDLCAPFEFWPEAGRAPERLFPDYPASIPTPMSVKRTLERELIEAGVPFLYQTLPVRAETDREGRFAGFLLANRGGFVAVAARAALDGTGELTACRLGGTPFEAFSPGNFPVERILIGAPAPASSGVACSRMPVDVKVGDRNCPAYRAATEMTFVSGDFAEVADAEVRMRRLCWSPEQILAVDRCTVKIPRVPAAAPSKEFPLIPASAPDATEQAAALAKKNRAGKPERVKSDRHEFPDEAVHFNATPRCESCPKIGFELNTLPRARRYDVLVAGGGTAGAPAAIAGAREAAKVLCVEGTAQLGGVGTVGKISRYWYGNRTGFSAEIDRGVAGMGPNPEYPADSGQWNPEWKQQYFLNSAARGGVELWFNSFAVGALRRGNQVTGAVIATPGGTFVVEAGAVVDATGNADVAAAAGAETRFSDDDEPALQGTGMSRAVPGVHYANCDYTFTVDSDAADLTRTFVAGREKYAAEFDLAQLAGTRERRRIVGEFTLKPEDFLLHRTYSDTLVAAHSNFDTHGFTTHPLFWLFPPGEEPFDARVPFRCLLPKTLDGILVTGLGISVHRDAMPVVRMEADVQNQGFAAGLIAAMTARHNRTVRGIRIRELQRMLISVGILPRETLEENDGIHPERAVAEFRRPALIFHDPAAALPKLREEFADAPGPDLAALLAALGDASGRRVLLAAIRNAEWDGGWDYRGMGQFGTALGKTDVLLMALSNIVNAECVPVLLLKLSELRPEMPFSHFRSICRNLWKVKTAEAAPLLEALLRQPGVSGHLHTTLEAMLAANTPDPCENGERNAQLKEIYLLKALGACDPANRYAREKLDECARALQFLYADFAAK